jgi:hypothetical protein
MGEAGRCTGVINATFGATDSVLLPVERGYRLSGCGVGRQVITTVVAPSARNLNQG